MQSCPSRWLTLNYSSGVRMQRRLTLQTCGQRDFGVENAGDRASSLRVCRGLVEGSFIAARNTCFNVQMTLSDRESRVSLFERDRTLRLDTVGSNAGFAKLSAQCHGETSGMRGGDQLLGICSLTAFKARPE